MSNSLPSGSFSATAEWPTPSSSSSLRSLSSVAPRSRSRRASASTRFFRVSIGRSRPPLAWTSMWSRLLVVLRSGTTWIQMRGPAPSGSMMQSVPRPSQDSGSPTSRRQSSQVAKPAGGGSRKQARAAAPKRASGSGWPTQLMTSWYRTAMGLLKSGRGVAGRARQVCRDPTTARRVHSGPVVTHRRYCTDWSPPVSVGDADVRVNGRRIVEQREHAGGEVGAGDAEAVWQVAVGRGAVGSPGGLAGERGRAENCPVQVAGVDLVLGAVEVGADVAEERAPDQGLEQVAQVGAFALIGDDGAADRE